MMVPAGSALSPGATAGIGMASLVVGWLVYDGMCRSPLARMPVALASLGFMGMTAAAYGLSMVFTPRATYIHVGAMMGTMMAIRGLVYFIVVFLAALGVWNTMMMSVLERTSEIGVLRAMGMTRLGAVLLFVGEAAAIGFIGSSVGVVAGVLPMLWMEKNPIVFGEDVTQNMGETFVIATEIYADLTPDIVVAGFVLGVVTAIVGSVLPAIHAASIQPVVAMRRK